MSHEISCDKVKLHGIPDVGCPNFPPNFPAVLPIKSGVSEIFEADLRNAPGTGHRERGIRTKLSVRVSKLCGLVVQTET